MRNAGCRGCASPPWPWRRCRAVEWSDGCIAWVCVCDGADAAGCCCRLPAAGLRAPANCTAARPLCTVVLPAATAVVCCQPPPLRHCLLLAASRRRCCCCRVGAWQPHLASSAPGPLVHQMAATSPSASLATKPRLPSGNSTMGSLCGEPAAAAASPAAGLLRWMSAGVNWLQPRGNGHAKCRVGTCV